MAYSGTTAASSVRNPPVNLLQILGRYTSTASVLGATGLSGNVYGGGGLWVYASTDGSTLIQAPGYFTDGLQLGMRVGDILFNYSASSLGTTVSNLGIGVIVTTNSTAGFNVATGAQIQSS
jgi:hypothetical protein